MKSPKVLTDRVVKEYQELDTYLSKVIDRDTCLYKLYIKVGDKNKGVYILELDVKGRNNDVYIHEHDVRNMYTHLAKLRLDDEFSHIFK